MSSSLSTPHAMWPPTMNARPPNIRRSDTSFRLPSSRRTRAASCSSYAIANESIDERPARTSRVDSANAVREPGSRVGGAPDRPPPRDAPAAAAFPEPAVIAPLQDVLRAVQGRRRYRRPITELELL